MVPKQESMKMKPKKSKKSPLSTSKKKLLRRMSAKCAAENISNQGGNNEVTTHTETPGIFTVAGGASPPGANNALTNITTTGTGVTSTTGGSSAVATSTATATTTNGTATPARRLRTRNSTGSGNASGGESAKKSVGAERDHHEEKEKEKPTVSVAHQVAIPMNHAGSSVSASKKYHNSCPHPAPPTHKKPIHTKPHSSNTFDINKNEEFHFDTPMECPIFYPTNEEFLNPLAFISKIRSKAENCGIAKIVPPESWTPPFAVDVDKLRFIPRVQRLNELEAKTRVKLNFLDQIAKFWELQGSSLKIPMVERKALDLYTLHRVVQEEGGMEQTTKERKWAKVANRMQYPPSKSVGATLKAHYERILHPFEVYTSGKVLGAPPPAATAVKLEDGAGTDYKAHEIPTRQQITPPNENSARRSKRFANSSANCGLSSPGGSSATGSSTKQAIKIEKEDCKRDLMSSFNAVNSSGSGAANSGGSGSSNSSGSGSSSTAPTTRGAQKKAPDALIDPLMKYICHICNRGDMEESMLLCDGCDDSYHTFCLLPPLSGIPKGEWLCPRCVVEEVSKPQEAFGFEQAEREYTLQQFGQMADQFKQDYFCKPVHLVSPCLVEREFWRIVSSIDEDVTVEYGADLHTMDHGSGFPTKSSQYLLPGDQEYAESTWNLNNLPLLEDSILGHINADISGMNAPWMYVGMCFAAFCWHNEDHWSYSINYLHWGEAKTWYGVPGSCAEQFEETMKKAAPELFASQPDLLHQLVTIMNPNILMNNGVPVYRTDQKPGEFVITFPRAYHAGFNQGYNFAEAVNFAPADWLKMGRECVNHYSMLRRFCVFSHDELVCKMALEPAKLTFGIATACYIDMVDMVDAEKKLRKSLLEWGVTRAVRKAFELVPDDERHCQECNTTCFLSAVACECTKDIVCLRHYTVLCSCPPEKHSLLYRYTLDEMPLMLQKLKIKAHNFERWLTRCRDIVDSKTPTTVTLQELQELCKEADTKRFPSSLLIDRLNAALNEAEKCVTVIQQLGINKVRTRSDHNTDAAQYKLTMEELELFVQEIDNLCCIIEEGASVRELLVLGKQFVERANVQLNQSIEALEESDLETLINDGNSLRIELLEMDLLNKRLKQCKWYKRSQGLRETSSKLTYNDIQQLLHVAAADIDPSDPYIDREIRKLQQIGADIEAWETQAAKYFRCLMQQHELADIEAFLQTATEINGQVPSYALLKDALRKAKDWLRSVEQLQKNNHFPYCHTLEAMIERGRNIPIQLEELTRMQGHLSSAHKWKDNTARAFLRKSTYYTLLEVLMPRAESINIDSDLKKPFEDDFLKEKNPAEIVDSFKHAEEKELRDMRDLRRTNMTKNPLRDVFCLCKAEFRGIMFNCQLCRDWFHEDCVPSPSQSNACQTSTASPTIVNNNNGTTNGNNDGFITNSPSPTLMLPTKAKWLCPSCVRSRRPRLETILPLLVQLQQLPIRLPEDEALRCLAERAMNWQDRARKALTSPDVTAALEALHVAQQEQRNKKPLGNISSPRSKPRRSSTRSNNNQASDTDDDDEGRLHIVEDGFSNDEDELTVVAPTQSNNVDETINNLDTQGDLFKLLSESEIENLMELMMEGDLLEVSLDETLELWRILEMVPPTALQEEANGLIVRFMHQQNTHPAPSSNVTSCAEDSNDSLLVQSSPNSNNSSGTPRNSSVKKRRSLDPNTGCPVPRKKTATPKPANKKTPRKSDPAAKQQATVSGGGGVQAEDAENKQANGGANTNSNASSTGSVQKRRKRTSTIATAAGGAGGNSNASPGAASAGGNNTTVSVASVGVGGGQKKHAQRAQQATQEDDEEECRAENCHKPTGREVDWVQCDGGCNEWFHMYCVGLNRSQIKADDDYICIRCSKTVTVAAIASGSSLSLTATATTTTTVTTATGAPLGSSSSGGGGSVSPATPSKAARTQSAR